MRSNGSSGERETSLPLKDSSQPTGFPSPGDHVGYFTFVLFLAVKLINVPHVEKQVTMKRE